MCGIFAISSQEQETGLLVLTGLKKLEYRGYDSWGIALRNLDDHIEITKEVGKISDINMSFPAGKDAMGHSRWATHGGVTKENSHPHKSGKVTLVHNGIFENFQTIKKQFPNSLFKSETDSEVIAVLINYFLEKGNSPQESIIKAIEKIEGRFSIVVMFDDIPGIFAARRGSPLILGRKKGMTFIASDIPAFLKETNIVNYLDDNEMVFINKDDVIFTSILTGKEVVKRDITVQWKVEEAEKGDFPHFMIKEIFDQKETIARAINHEDEILEKASTLLKASNGAYFIACGTAHKVAMTAEYYFSEISGKKINVVPASEMPYFEKFINPKTCLVVVSQSGETADILEVVERAKTKGAKILSMTNVESSSIARLSDVHLPINAGPEKAVASTKATTAQMALVFLLAHTNKGISNIGRDILRSTIGNINDMINPRYEEYIKEVGQKIYKTQHLFIIGRGSLYPMALESAIKIQEVAYINAQGFAAGELKHGPIALIEKNTPCIVLGDDQETISNAIELKSRGAMIIGIAPEKNEVFDEWLKVPNCNEAQAIPTIIPVQILAYHLAVLKKLNPDMPRNLAKSVTVK